MKKTILFTAVLIVISLTLPVSLPVTAKSNSHKLTYSNLYDKSTRVKTIQQMEKAGITTKNVDGYFKYVKRYHKNMSAIPLAKKGFTAIDNYQPGYDEGKAMEFWQASADGELFDLNCRITAFLLLKDKIKFTGKDKYTGVTSAFDMETIRSFKVSELSKRDKIIYKNLYGDIKVGKMKSPIDSAKMVQNYWKKNKISFRTNKNVSMINVFQYFDLDQTIFVGHAGVLMKSGSEYLFIEKYAPTLPYQISKFSSKTELYNYLMNRLDVGDGNHSVGAFIMENDKLLSPSPIKQQIQTEQLVSGVINKMNAQFSYSLTKRGNVTISIFTANGKLAAKYKEVSISPTQRRWFSWDGTTTKENQLQLKNGTYAPSGSYYAQISAQNTTVKTKTFQMK